MLTWIAPLVVMDLVLSAIGCGDGQPGITPLPTPATILAPTPASASDGLPEIYVMDADGFGQTRLTDNPHGDQDPSWSPSLPKN